MLLLLWFGLKGLLMFELYGTGMKTQQLEEEEEEEEEELFICHTHSYTEYNQQWNVCSAFNPSKSTHTWSSGHTHTHTWSSGHTHTHRHTHTHTHTPRAVGTHTPGAVETHTHTWSSGHIYTDWLKLNSRRSNFLSKISMIALIHIHG